MKIFAQYSDTKFINSLIDSEISNLVVGKSDNNLYKIHYQYNFDAYIFSSDSLSKETIQFSQEFCKSKRIVVYHQFEINTDVVDFLTGCKHISENANMPKLINKHIFYNTNNNNRTNDIACFLDAQTTIPSNIFSFLYPNTKLPIKIYSKNIKYIHSLGYATEKEKAQILNSSKQYLSIDNIYDNEAVECGCEVVEIVESNILPKKLKTDDSITYSEFIEEILK